VGVVTYYNDNDESACAWLAELIRAELIPAGTVDARSIADVVPADLAAHTHCHFFAGIGGWAHALELASWRPDRPVWTASLPCQPFSAAGKRAGAGDERHLWPIFHDLVAECRPAAIFGEQVASADGKDWLAAVFDDLGALGYITAGADLCASGCGAPHIRQRLYWGAVRMGNTDRELAGRDTGTGTQAQGGARVRAECDPAGPSGTNGWANVVYLPCGDGKARPIESAAERMAPRFPPLVVPGRDPGSQIDPENSAEGRVMRLKGYGNSITIPLAVAFIESFRDAVQTDEKSR